jgi:hypothetical protein
MAVNDKDLSQAVQDQVLKQGALIEGEASVQSTSSLR